MIELAPPPARCPRCGTTNKTPVLCMWCRDDDAQHLRDLYTKDGTGG